MRRFEGLSALLSGAAGGFGQGIAAALAQEGARLLLTDLDGDRLDDFAATLRGKGAEVETLAGDIADEAFAGDLVKVALERFGALDVAVNNAGVSHDFKRLPSIEAAEAERVIAVDLMGVFFAMKRQLPVMEARFEREGRPGAIVNIASVAGLRGAPMLSVYAAAKHGVVGLTRSAAAEYARRGVRINAVCPSFARTPMVTDGIDLSEGQGESHVVRGIPMRRLGEVSEIVAAVLFAADPANSFMTGVAIPVDGGLSAL